MTEIPIEEDALSPIDFIPTAALGAAAKGGAKLIFRKLVAARSGGKEAAAEAGTIAATLAARMSLEGGLRLNGADVIVPGSRALSCLHLPDRS